MGAGGEGAIEDEMAREGAGCGSVGDVTGAWLALTRKSASACLGGCWLPAENKGWLLSLPTRHLCPWASPGKNTEVGCHALLQGVRCHTLWQPAPPGTLRPLFPFRRLACLTSCEQRFPASAKRFLEIFSQAQFPRMCGGPRGPNSQGAELELRRSGSSLGPSQ